LLPPKHESRELSATFAERPLELPALFVRSAAAPKMQLTAT